MVLYLNAPLFARAECTKLRFRLRSFCCFYFSGRGLYELGICEMI